jgi:hypothetical protein
MKRTLISLLIIILIFNLTDCFSQYQFISDYTEFGRKNEDFICFEESVTFKIHQYSVFMDTIEVQLDFVRSIDNEDGHSLLIFRTASNNTYSFYYYKEEVEAIVFENRTHRIKYNKRIIRI